MDPHNRFERRTLRDVLVAQGVLTEELADELMTSAREDNEPFGAVVIDAGHMTPWDLAKTVSAHYNLPCLPLADFTFDPELAEGIPPATLYQYQVVPVGRFGKVRSFAVIEPPPRECLAALTEACGPRLFFFAAEAHEVRRVLQENVKVMDAHADDAWQSIFDAADQNVLDEG